MEQARLFMAVALSIIVFVIWDHFFVPKQPMNPPGSQEITESITSDALKSTGETTGLNPSLKVDSKPAIPSDPNRIAKKITVNTNLLEIIISESGGVIESCRLNNYTETLNGDQKKEIVTAPVDIGTLQFDFLNKSVPDLQYAIFQVDNDSTKINATDHPQTLTLKWTSETGITIIKAYTFTPDSYLFNYDVTIQNNSGGNINDSIRLSLVNNFPEKRGYAFEGPCALIDDSLEEVKLNKIKKQSIYPGDIQWIAVQNRYFMTGIIPEAKDRISMHLATAKTNILDGTDTEQTYDHLDTHLVQEFNPILPNTQTTFDYQIYFGPKSVQILKNTGYRLDKAVNFGWFDFLAKPCLWLMNFFHQFIPNYGLAIIFLTILVKLIFWPLGNKSYKSMNDMKKIQPLIAQLNEKYKNDPQKKNQEMMALYKTYKINPLGGCLPMLVQMPIFFALYRMLYSAIELRHAPFIGWINDLSAPDRLFDFGVQIPFFEPPTGIPVLTLVMGASMFVQQKMSPPAGDPSQARMMMMMPIFMTLIFINFSSGLVLYWLVNNILSIAQQYYISRKTN